jgi:hypothetical protein
MAFIEGGVFKCDKHGIETASVEEWNDHCYGNPEHTESGTTVCRSCGVAIEFSELPFHKLDVAGSKNISLTCPKCEQQAEGTVKRTVVK